MQKHLQSPRSGRQRLEGADLLTISNNMRSTCLTRTPTSSTTLFFLRRIDVHSSHQRSNHSFMITLAVSSGALEASV